MDIIARTNVRQDAPTTRARNTLANVALAKQVFMDRNAIYVLMGSMEDTVTSFVHKDADTASATKVVEIAGMDVETKIFEDHDAVLASVADTETNVNINVRKTVDFQNVQKVVDDAFTGASQEIMPVEIVSTAKRESTARIASTIVLKLV